MKYAMARAGIRFGWWLMSFGERVIGWGTDLTDWVDKRAQNAGLDHSQMITPVVDAVYGPAR